MKSVGAVFIQLRFSTMVLLAILLFEFGLISGLFLEQGGL